MIRRRKLLALTLAAAMALLTIGCEDKLTKACSVLRAGRYTLETFAYPALEVGATLPVPPVWVAGYRLSRTGLDAVLGRLEGFCVRAEREGGVRYEDVAPSIAEASQLISELLILWRDAQAAGVVPTTRAGAGVDRDIEALLADLAEVQAEARR